MRRRERCDPILFRDRKQGDWSGPQSVPPVFSPAFRIWQGNGGKGIKAKRQTSFQTLPPHSLASIPLPLPFGTFVAFCSNPSSTPVSLGFFTPRKRRERT